MSSRDVDLKDVFSHELAPVSTSMFEDSGEMRITKSKSTLKRKLQVEQSSRTLPTPGTIVVDGCAILWTIQWPKHGTVQDYVNNVLEYIFGKLQHSDVNVIFDRYYEYSIKSSTRTSRTVQPASRRHRLTPSTPLPAQSVVLTVTVNKKQIIGTICEQLRKKGKTHEATMKHSLLVTGSSSIPVEIFKGVAIERRDLETTHEEADVIIPRQVVDAATQGSKCIKVICDDTDVFILLIPYYQQCSLTCIVLMEGTSRMRAVIEIGATAKQHADIAGQLLAAHALTGCDTVAFVWE